MEQSPTSPVSKARIWGALPAFFALIIGLLSENLVRPWSHISIAVATPARTDPWTLAQQAFARLDFQNSYRYSMESIKVSPQNTDARRLAAKSAKELNRNSECLRIMQETNFSQPTPDDVGLVGECSALSQFTPWSIAFLQQNVTSTLNHDIASFWLGRYFYRKSEYLKAEKNLKDVSVLPARLEKERLFMLERTHEVLRAAQPLPTPTSIPEKPASEVKRDPVGLFFTPNAQVFVGNAVLVGKKTPIAPKDQVEFEAADNLTAPSAIKSKSFVTNDFYLDGRANFLLGIVTPIGNRGAQLKFASDAIASVTQSNFIDDFYAPRGQSVRPSQVGRRPSKGWSFSVNPSVDFAMNRNFSVGGFAQYEKSSPGFKYQLSKILAEGYLKLEFDQYQIKPCFNYFWEFGQDGRAAGISNQWGLDFRMSCIGFIGFFSPQGYPLVRYSRFLPIGRSKSVILFTQYEGEFWEVNLAPRAYFSDYLNMMVWYRYVSGTKQSYVAGATVDKVIAEGSYRLFQPSSDYSSLASDLTAEVEWTPHKNFSLGAGVLFRKLVTTYAEDSDLDNTQKYSTLLDRSGETYNRYFIEGRVQF